MIGVGGWLRPGGGIDEYQLRLGMPVSRSPRHFRPSGSGCRSHPRPNPRELADARRGVEAEIASFPSYHATVEYKGHNYKIHFLALFSAKRDATPVVFSHGWPGKSRVSYALAPAF